MRVSSRKFYRAYLAFATIALLSPRGGGPGPTASLQCRSINTAGAGALIYHRISDLPQILFRVDEVP